MPRRSPSTGVKHGTVQKRGHKDVTRSRFVNCPICDSAVLEFRINEHIDEAHVIVEKSQAGKTAKPSSLVCLPQQEGGSDVRGKGQWWKPATAANIPAAHAKLTGSGDSRRLHPLTSAQLRESTPCELIADALPRDLADGLLQDLQSLCEAWSRGTWHMFGKAHEAPRTSCYFELTNNQDLEAAREQGTTFDISSDVSTAVPPERLLEAASIVNRLVSEASGRVEADLLPDDRHGWSSSYALANCYRDGTEGVGPHSDRLQTLGPRAVIASLSLGAKRTFRISRADLKSSESSDEAARTGGSDAVLANQGAGAVRPESSQRVDSADIPLPHNTLVIMWPPMQEEWRHAVPKSTKVEKHPLSGTRRFNLTFRKTKPAWVAKAPVCRCNRQSVLKAALGRGTGRAQRYFYQCDNTKNAACGFWKWMDPIER